MDAFYIDKTRKLYKLPRLESEFIYPDLTEVVDDTSLTPAQKRAASQNTKPPKPAVKRGSGVLTLQNQNVDTKLNTPSARATAALSMPAGQQESEEDQQKAVDDLLVKAEPEIQKAKTPQAGRTVTVSTIFNALGAGILGAGLPGMRLSAKISTFLYNRLGRMIQGDKWQDINTDQSFQGTVANVVARLQKTLGDAAIESTVVNPAAGAAGAPAVPSQGNTGSVQEAGTGGGDFNYDQTFTEQQLRTNWPNSMTGKPNKAASYTITNKSGKQLTYWRQGDEDKYNQKNPAGGTGAAPPAPPASPAPPAPDPAKDDPAKPKNEQSMRIAMIIAGMSKRNAEAWKKWAERNVMINDKQAIKAMLTGVIFKHNLPKWNAWVSKQLGPDYTTDGGASSAPQTTIHIGGVGPAQEDVHTKGGTMAGDHAETVHGSKVKSPPLTAKNLKAARTAWNTQFGSEAGDKINSFKEMKGTTMYQYDGHDWVPLTLFGGFNAKRTDKPNERARKAMENGTAEQAAKNAPPPGGLMPDEEVGIGTGLNSLGGPKNMMDTFFQRQSQSPSLSDALEREKARKGLAFAHGGLVKEMRQFFGSK